MQCADELENFHEPNQMQSETKSVVSIEGIFERKDYQQYAVEVYHCFTEVDLRIIQTGMVIKIQIRKKLKFSSKNGPAVRKGDFVTGREFSVIGLLKFFRSASCF